MKYFISLFIIVNVLLFSACENSNTPAKTTDNVEELEKNNNEVFLKKGKEAGATGWLVKPFDPKRLLEVIGKVIG